MLRTIGSHLKQTTRCTKLVVSDRLVRPFFRNCSAEVAFSPSFYKVATDDAQGAPSQAHPEDTNNKTRCYRSWVRLVPLTTALIGVVCAAHPETIRKNTIARMITSVSVAFSNSFFFIPTITLAFPLALRSGQEPLPQDAGCRQTDDIVRFLRQLPSCVWRKLLRRFADRAMNSSCSRRMRTQLHLS